MWRTAGPGDDAAVVAMWRALNAEDPAAVPPAADAMPRTLAALRAVPARGRVAVLVLHGRAMGYALLIAFWDNEQGGELCTVDELFVAAAARGQGHATALLRDLAGGRGPWPGRPVALDLEVSPDNARARRLYQRLGFRPLRNAAMRLVT